MDRNTHYYKLPAFTYKSNENKCVCFDLWEPEAHQESNRNSNQLKQSFDLWVFGASFWYYDNKFFIKLQILTKQVLV